MSPWRGPLGLCSGCALPACLPTPCSACVWGVLSVLVPQGPVVCTTQNTWSLGCLRRGQRLETPMFAPPWGRGVTPVSSHVPPGSQARMAPPFGEGHSLCSSSSVPSYTPCAPGSPPPAACLSRFSPASRRTAPRVWNAPSLKSTSAIFSCVTWGNSFNLSGLKFVLPKSRQ